MGRKLNFVQKLDNTNKYDNTVDHLEYLQVVPFQKKRDCELLAHYFVCVTEQTTF